MVSYIKKNTGAVLVFSCCFILAVWETFFPSGKIFQDWIVGKVRGIFSAETFLDSLIFYVYYFSFFVIVWHISNWKIDKD